MAARRCRRPHADERPALSRAGPRTTRRDSKRLPATTAPILRLSPNIRPSHAGEGPMVISALMKVADADAAAKKIPEALLGYQRAAQFAEKIKNPGLQSLALAHAADSRSTPATSATAAQSFQQALIVDETQGDATRRGHRLVQLWPVSPCVRINRSAWSSPASIRAQDLHEHHSR